MAFPGGTAVRNAYCLEIIYKEGNTEIMIEELCKNIYRIGVPLPGNPLKELNSYFIKGKDSDLLIDTGFRREPCLKALQEGLDELASDPARRDVLLTHLHSDHSGLADLLVGKGRKIYIHEKDHALLLRFRETTIPEFRYQRFIEEGFAKSDLDEMFRTNPAMTEAMDSTACTFSI
ncbi:MAG: MBL fold metallo-hydrolase, partial [Eubacterium sp.]|nr:MBL fold metallo-hydrolase [Eubacterium sp.]